jgi:disulfide bond formation protein DsbB
MWHPRKVSTATVTTLYGLLGLAAIAALVWLAVMAVGALLSDGVGDSFDDGRERLAPYVLWAAFLVALLATAGSLYFSEVAHFVPCQLCWYQRIAMYPLVLILGIAASRRDMGVGVYVIPLAAVGAAISTYHYLLEWFPSIEAGTCSVGIPCSQVWFREFGFISLPLLALLAFLLVIALLLIPDRGSPDAREDAAPT